MRKPDLLHVNYKGADQPVLLPSLISAFVLRSLEGMIAKLAICKISIFLSSHVH